MSKDKYVLEKIVWCTFRFTAKHYWPEAKPPVEYLKHPHRHEFHIRAGTKVTDSDREVEFIQLKERLQAYCKHAFEGRTFEYSCEQMAEELVESFNLAFCEVSEDGENGATVARVKA